MRHRNSGRKLGRTSSHRKATLSSLSVALIRHKKIRTTTAKAKEARMVVEKLITKAKNAVAKEGEAKGKNVHARREAFAFLRDREAVGVLFNEIAGKVASRPGGYTRVVKLGQRQGDGAEVAILELVDYNTGREKAAPKPKAKAATGRKRGPKGKPETSKKAKEKTVEAEASEVPAETAPSKSEAKESDSK